MKYLYFLFCFFYSVSLFGQNTDIKTTLTVVSDADESSYSSASGKNMIQYNNYRLFDLLSVVYKVPVEYFQLEKVKINPLINFEVRNSGDVLEQLVVKKELSNAIKKVLKLNVEVINKNKLTTTMTLIDEDKLEICEENINTKDVIKKNVIVNRTFKGTCVNSNELIEVINEWYSTNIINEMDRSLNFNISMHRSNNFNEFNKEMMVFYGIKFIEKNQLVQTLLIKQL